MFCTFYRFSYGGEIKLKKAKIRVFISWGVKCPHFINPYSCNCMDFVKLSVWRDGGKKADDVHFIFYLGF